MQNNGITFDAENHLYFNEKGFIVPSVNEIINKVYGSGLENAPADLVQRAADKGKKIHAEIEAFINNRPLPEVVAPETNNFIIYANKYLRLDIYAKTEIILHGKTPFGEVCGTADLFCNGELIDYKTSKTATRAQISHWQKQLSFYFFILKQMGKSVLKMKVLHLTAEGCEVIELEYLGDDFVLKTMEMFKNGEKATKEIAQTDYPFATIPSGTLLWFVETVKYIERLKNEQENLREMLKQEMAARNILNFEIGGVSFSYIAPTKRKSFDKAKFRKEHADLYAIYQTEIPVTDSVRITVKEDKNV